MNAQSEFQKMYSYQNRAVKSPLVQAWLSCVELAVADMQGVEVEFATSFVGKDDDNMVYHDHANQLVSEFMTPVLRSTDNENPNDEMDEECLPYYRVRFADGVEIMADDSELFSDDPRFARLVASVSGAFACARELGYVGPWHLAAEGSEVEKQKFHSNYEAQLETFNLRNRATNHNTPARFRVTEDAGAA